MTTICLIRHGETDWNSQKRLQGIEDIELNDKGRIQAKNCVKLLNNCDWDMIVTSPLKRARETAEIIAGEMGMHDVIVMNEFIERDFGLASGLTQEERKIKFSDGIIDGEESKDDLRQRVMSALTELSKSYDGKRIIVVSHGAVINCILNTISNGEIGSNKTILKNACISIIHYDDDNWDIEVFNIA